MGPYEVVAPLGQGGMAEVYRARDTRLGREVALKVVSEALAGDGELLGRFEREARLAGSLNHPNVVAVHDVGLHEGSPFFVTELLEGQTLRDRLARGPVPLATALDWGVQMAQGLAAAHERGIVHRDLKPENVFLTRDGHVKLLDFGIAKLVESARRREPHGLMDATEAPSGGATGTGRVIGTPGYMSPEQVRGDPIDARTDSFSLGEVLYEMLSGRRAFPGGSLVESGHAILHAEPAPLPPEVPPAVAQVVLRCLEKEPERRFQSARDLAFNLELLRAPTATAPTIAGPAPVRRRRWRWMGVGLVAAVLLALAAGLVAGRAWRGGPGQPLVKPLTFRRGSILAARFGPDGKTVHFSASWGDGPPRVYTTTVEAPEVGSAGIEDAQL
ncbi:MAG TPA: serine/threonine-protein kinase, partial [Myxococcaceae bacterium]|nr:serine/threonine-protein kinase [Myxococcaceae bacterium]